MRSDRTLKILLAMIVLSLWALTLTQVGTPVAGATESAQPLDETAAMGTPRQSAAPGAKQADPNPGVSRAPTSPLPLRWRVSWATLATGTSDTYCGTAVIVTNTTNADIDVDVEFMKNDGTSAGRASETIPAYGNHTAVTVGPSLTVNVGPYFWDDQIATGEFSGYALVGGDDPRIMVSAFQFCRSSTGYSGAFVRSHANIPAFPVGTTAEFFQAGLPTGWAPAVAVTEEPQ